MSIRLALKRSLDDAGLGHDSVGRRVVASPADGSEWMVAVGDDDVCGGGGATKKVRGKCSLFTVAQPGGATGGKVEGGGGNLIREEITARTHIDPDSIVRRFIECTSMQGFDRACKQATCAFRKNGDNGWTLAVVERYDPLGDSIAMYCWNGNEDAFSSKTWDDKNFVLVELALRDIELRWVNQVSGKAPGGGRVPEETRCHIDGAIQCLVGGPDKWPFNVPWRTYDRTKTKGLEQFNIEKDTKFEYRNMFKKKSRRYKQKKSNVETSTDEQKQTAEQNSSKCRKRGRQSL